AIIALAGGDVMAAEPKDFRGHATLTIQGMSDGKTVTDLPVLVRFPTLVAYRVEKRNPFRFKR
ncbi:MAG: hypothetical protein K6G94_09235, partial [Kiritimatiellae bacterium]|nr:hypothetical protein [Kiritimatiellia bacterium]